MDILLTFHYYTPHEGLSWANQKSRKFGVFGGNPLPFYCYFEIIGENDILMYLFIDMKYAGDQDYKP